MIDTNNQFGNLVEGSNPATTPNPGFEFEVVFASNFDVSIYDHRGKASGGTKIWSGSVNQFSQRAVAASTGSGNPDYFYDFYVPFSAFPSSAEFPLNANTPLRFSGITVTSAQSGISGTVSDVGGVNFASYGHSKQRAWADVISNFPATSLNQLQAGEFVRYAVAPVVTGPITAGSTTISGTSIEAVGSVITVYRNGVQICGGSGQPACPTVSSTGSWTMTGISSSLLLSGDVITATVTATGKPVSALSAGVTVSALCTATPAPVITGLTGSGQSRGFTGTTSYPESHRITVYGVGGASIVTVDVPAGATTWTTGILSLPENSFYATARPLSGGTLIGCESIRSNFLCFRNGQPNVNNQVLTITDVTYNSVTQTSTTSATWSEVPTNITRIAGSLSLGGTSIAGNIVVFLNGAPTSVSTAFTTATTTWFIDIPTSFSSTLRPGDVLSVRTDITLTGGGQTTCPNSYSRASNLLNVQATSAAPTINALGCGRVTVLTGTSTEPAGTVIQFYTGGTTGQRDGTLVVLSGTTTPVTATVNAQGAWAADLTGVAGGGISAGTVITARAKAVGKVRSLNSNAVSSTAAAAAPTITGPITEGATTISGTGAAPGSQVTLIIDGTPFSPVTATSTGAFSVVGLSAFEVFAGASVTATYTTSTGGGCASNQATPVIVQCAAPATPAFTTGTASVCNGGTTSVTLQNTQEGISYALVTRSGTSPNFTYTAAGSSVLGTGGAITLTSAALTTTGTTTLYVRARKISGTTCDAVSTNTLTVTVNPLPVTTGLPASTSTTLTCPGSTSVSVSGSNASYNYQLETTTGSLVGAAVQGNGGTISLLTNTISAPTVYNLRITDRTTGCITRIASFFTVGFSSGPTLTNTVSTTAAICANTPATVVVSAPQTGYTYQLYNASTNAAVGNAVQVAASPAPATISLVTPALAAGTYTYYVGVRATSGTCTNEYRLNNQVTVAAQLNPTAIASFATQCGSNLSVTLTSTTPSGSGGTWTVTRSANTTSPLPVITNPTSAVTTATGLNSGNFTFTWTAAASCTGGGTVATVEVRVNCPAEYLVAAPRYREDYTAGTVLASVTDVDGGIVSAGLVLGNILPAGTALSPTTGLITVTNPAELLPGTYTVSIRTVDQRNVETVSTIILTFYGQAPAVAPLPVELAYFTAVVEKGKISLKWMTATEENNDRFEVERSSNGRDYTALGTVKGQGTSTIASKYSFADKAPASGTAYYRLKQVDADGKFAYSNILAVETAGVANNVQLQAYPNPFTDHITVAVTAPVAEKAQLQLIDVQGRVLLTKTVSLNKGVTELELGVQQLAGGVYILKVTGNGIEAKARVLKTH